MWKRPVLITVLISVLLVVAACGGGGGTSSVSSGSSSSSSSSPTVTLSNFTTITVGAGPAAADGNVNIPYVTVTICAPGTKTCQTIDHIILDTGSVGLRIEREALNSTLLGALPHRQTTTGVDAGECYQYVDGYVFGSVRGADFTIGGESVSDMPFMVIGDNGTYATVPASCSSSGGSSHNTVADFGANGIIGIGTGQLDCGTYCTTTVANSYYFACPSTGCVDATIASANQIPNPVTKMAVNNNGTVIDLPAVTGFGTQTLSGTVYFGIGTQTNNTLTTQTILPFNTNGYLTATYKGAALTKSFVDSGTNFYGFSDSAITTCTGSLAGFYCPTSTLDLIAVLSGKTGSATVNFHVDNTNTLNSFSYYVMPGLAGDPASFENLTPYTNSFDLGLPFFYGRKVYTAISGKTAAGATGPYVAF